MPLAQLGALFQRLADFDLVAVPLQKGVDEKIIKRLKKHIRICPYDPEKIMYEIASADMAIGMRLHFLVLAACFQVPFIGLAYDPKVSGFCKHLQMPFASVENAATLGKLIHHAFPKRHYYKGQLQTRLEQEIQVAQGQVFAVQDALRHAFG